MFTLCGFAVSNYFNKVKLAMLEKRVWFDVERVRPGSSDPAVLAASPLGKIPYLKTEHGTLCESQVILEFLEAEYPEPRLLPADPWAAAKVREIGTFVDLHLELVARALYPAAFDGAALDDATRERVKAQLVRNIAAFKTLARFSPYVAGDTFTMADCSAWPSLPLVGLATKIVYGEDLLLAAGVDWKAYAKVVEERPSAAQVAADRKAALVQKS